MTIKRATEKEPLNEQIIYFTAANGERMERSRTYRNSEGKMILHIDRIVVPIAFGPASATTHKTQ